jgi:ZIP family zinc transporter
MADAAGGAFDPSSSSSSAAWETFKLTALPSTVMALGGLSVSVLRLNEDVVGATQHFAAGIVICAVAQELLPPVSDAPSTPENLIAIAGGFSAGVAAMLLVGAFCGEPEDAEGEGVAAVSERTPQLARSYGSSVGTEGPPRRSSLGTSPFLSQRQSLRQLAHKSSSARVARYPIALAFAVCIDACVDGLLIGISVSSGASAGLILAVALSFEMLFLGVTFSTSLVEQRRAVWLASVLGSSFMLVIGGQAGALFSGAIAGSLPLKLGLLSFGMAALLYLVTEELLLEAHKGGADAKWWVDLSFFIGFLACVLLEKIVG